MRYSTEGEFDLKCKKRIFKKLLYCSLRIGELSICIVNSPPCPKPLTPSARFPTNNPYAVDHLIRIYIFNSQCSGHVKNPFSAPHHDQSLHDLYILQDRTFVDYFFQFKICIAILIFKHVAGKRVALRS